jgi:nitrile hydratase accessory protein
MSAKLDSSITEMQGVTALPRQNGEPVFEEIWQSRAFGIAVALYNQGKYPWENFRDGLAEQIKPEDCKFLESSGTTPEFHYYDHWVATLEKLLLERGLLSQQEIEQRKTEFKTGQRREVF